MFAIFVTLLVSKLLVSRLVSFEQPPNMLAIFVTLLVSNPEKSIAVQLVMLLNIL